MGGKRNRKREPVFLYATNRLILDFSYWIMKSEKDDSRKDAKHAKVRFFAQSGDHDWANDSAFRRTMFLFVVVSRQTKKRNSLRPLRLCGEFLKKFFAGLAQPKADPSSGGVLARKTLLKSFC